MTGRLSRDVLPDLPPQRRTGAPYRVAVVCLGNICRSPMADVVLNDRIRERGLEGTVEVVSAGTGDWHVGGPMDRRAAALLTSHGYDASTHRAQQFGVHWFDEVDLVLAMDADNYTDIVALGPAAQVRMFRDFDPTIAAGDQDRDVPDPYYGGDDGFEQVLAMVERTADAVVDAVASHLSAGPAEGSAAGPAAERAPGSDAEGPGTGD